MQAIMLAAGLGTRLSGHDPSHPPKSMLQFGGRTLFERHLETLKGFGVEGLILVVGYRKEEMFEAIGRAGAADYVTTVHNPFYKLGAVVSLWQTGSFLRNGKDTLFMDADVLYHPDLIGRLVGTSEPDCLLLDRDYVPGDEPVKLCIRDGRPVEFGKKVEGTFDAVGEWPGFMRISAGMGPVVADKCQSFLDRNRAEDPYEPAFREIIVDDLPGAFGHEDITGLPWIEIDFPEDVARAREEILPRIGGTGR